MQIIAIDAKQMQMQMIAKDANTDANDAIADFLSSWSLDFFLGVQKARIVFSFLVILFLFALCYVVWCSVYVGPRAHLELFPERDRLLVAKSCTEFL